MQKRPILLWVIISLVGLSCLADIGTFFYFIANNNASFEINPIFIFLKGYLSIALTIAVVVLYKLLVNAAIIWLLLKYKPSGTHLFAFFIVISTLVAILLQFVGAWQNISVHQEIATSPVGSVQPLTTPQAYSIFNTALTWYGIFILLQTIIFLIYERLYTKH